MLKDTGHAPILMAFLEYLKIKHYAPSSMDSYSYWLSNFFIYIEQNNKILKEIAKEDILKYEASLKQRGYAAATIEHVLCSIRIFFDYLEETFYILINPLEGLLLHKSPVREPVVLTEKEAKKILDQPNTSTLIGVRDKAILELLYSTGLRIGEVYRLTVFDIDITSGFVRITKSKFLKDRFAPLTKPACYWLKQYINNVRPRFSRHNPKEQALFLGLCGKRFNSQLIARIVTAYAKAAKIKKHVTVHTFRHSLATHLLNNNVDITKIQRLLGHSHLSVTRKYTKVDFKQVKEVHQKFHPREADKNGE